MFTIYIPPHRRDSFQVAMPGRNHAADCSYLATNVCKPGRRFEMYPGKNLSGWGANRSPYLLNPFHIKAIRCFDGMSQYFCVSFA